MGHAGGVRSHVASICDRSSDPMSIFGKVDFSYIDPEKVIIQNWTFKIGLGQTAPPKMFVMTIGWYWVFGRKVDLTWYFPSKFRFFGQTWIFIFLYNNCISWGNNIIKGSCIFGRIPEGPSCVFGRIPEGPYQLRWLRSHPRGSQEGTQRHPGGTKAPRRLQEALDAESELPLS